MTWVSESEALHARVLSFARAALAGARTDETFDAIAVAIARHQAAHIPGFRRLIESRGAALVDASTIPSVPVDVFRLTRVAVHPPASDAVRFLTSGTTSGAQGLHAMRTTATYRELSLAWGRRAFSFAPARPVVVALSPAPRATPNSSLGFMMREFMATFDGRALGSETGGIFDADHADRWLLGPDGVDLEGLRRVVAVARGRGDPVLLLTTSFALVLLLDALGEDSLPLPDGSAVMTTGGFKGRTREIPSAELERAAARALHVPALRILGEYGMTELTSQLYERKPGAVRAPTFYVPPPWLRVVPVDPETLSPVPESEVGIARFVDLGNVDSAVAIVTADLVRAGQDGIELLGRRSGAPPRGCSLAVEEMVLGAHAPGKSPAGDPG